MPAEPGGLSFSLVNQDLVAGTLVHWGDVEGPDFALWTLYPSRRLLSAHICRHSDHLRKAFP